MRTVVAQPLRFIKHNEVTAPEWYSAVSLQRVKDIVTITFDWVRLELLPRVLDVKKRQFREGQETHRAIKEINFEFSMENRNRYLERAHSKNHMQDRLSFVCMTELELH